MSSTPPERPATSSVGIAASAGGTAKHFLPHVQGLRAIAVLLVVIYHVWPGRLEGGYVGVDVFFVISGFLITGQLVRELDTTGRIRLGTFWAKRARRLLPAAILVLVVSAVLALVFLPVSMLPDSIRELLASTFYVENWVLAASSVDYLASTDPSIAQHFWTLSLEEQFYLVWPPLLIAALWFGRRFLRGSSRPALVGVVVGVTAISFALSVVLTQVVGPPAYFTTYTRMWEFGVGALLALLPALRASGPLLGPLVGWTGVAIVLGTGWFYDADVPFPGSAAALPVLGAALVIAAPVREHWWQPATVLGSWPGRFIGDLSYSLYLWHWPLIIVAPFIPGWDLEWYNRIALLVATFVLAWLTKRFVEDPVRTAPGLVRGRLRRTWTLALGLMAVSSLAVGALAAVRTPEYDREAAQLAAVRADPPACFGALGSAQGLECDGEALGASVIPSPGFANADKPRLPQCLSTGNDGTLRPCHFGPGANPHDPTASATDAGAPRIALIGDSHAYQFIDVVAALAADEGWSLTTYLKGACPWNALPNPHQTSFGVACRSFQSALADELATAEPYDVIITTAISTSVFEGASGDTFVEDAAAGYVDAWAGAQGASIVVVRDNPAWLEDPNKCLRASDTVDDCVRARADALVDPDPIAVAAAEADAALIDLTDWYCDDEVCYAVVNGANVYRDADHLTETWATTMTDRFRLATRHLIQDSP